jgi:hypothetical protein
VHTLAYAYNCSQTGKVQHKCKILDDTKRRDALLAHLAVEVIRETGDSVVTNPFFMDVQRRLQHPTIGSRFTITDPPRGDAFRLAACYRVCATLATNTGLSCVLCGTGMTFDHHLRCQRAGFAQRHTQVMSIVTNFARAAGHTVRIEEATGVRDERFDHVIHTVRSGSKFLTDVSISTLRMEKKEREKQVKYNEALQLPRWQGYDFLPLVVDPSGGVSPTFADFLLWLVADREESVLSPLQYGATAALLRSVKAHISQAVAEANWDRLCRCVGSV